MTRNATVKLCHFGQSKALVTEQMKAECRTPLGKEEFMSCEKLFNLRKARSLEDCRSYGFGVDIWSVGVLILSMISYFPNEKFQKLRKDFALVLDQEQMPFIWLTSDMVVGFLHLSNDARVYVLLRIFFLAIACSFTQKRWQ